MLLLVGVPLRPRQGALARRDRRRGARRAVATDRRAARGRHARRASAALARARRAARSTGGDVCRYARLARRRAVSRGSSGPRSRGGRTGERSAYTDTMAAWRGSGDRRTVRALARDVEVRLRRHVGTGAGSSSSRSSSSRWWPGRGPRRSAPTCARGRWPTRLISPRCSTPSRASSGTSSRSSRCSSSWLGAGWADRRGNTWRDCSCGAVPLLVLFVVGQYYWTDILWRFVPSRPATTHRDDRRGGARRPNFARAKMWCRSTSRRREGWDCACVRGELSGIRPKEQADDGGLSGRCRWASPWRGRRRRRPGGRCCHRSAPSARPRWPVRRRGRRSPTEGDGAPDRAVGEGRPVRQGARQLPHGGLELVAGTTFVTSPRARASAAGTVRGSSSSSLARAGPTSRGSVHEAPESHESAMPANDGVEAGALRRDPEVAREREAEARAGGDAVERGDDRLVHRRRAR